jgi:hypothetical protein
MKQIIFFKEIKMYVRNNRLLQKNAHKMKSANDSQVNIHGRLRLSQMLVSCDMIGKILM